MRRAGAGLIAGVLALAGCKGTDPKAADKKDSPSATAARGKGRGPTWYDDSMANASGAGTDVPAAGARGNPKDPNFDLATESRGLLAGKVLDLGGQGVKGVLIRIEPVDPLPKEREGAPIVITTDAAGYFMTNTLPPGRAYNLIVQAKLDGRPVYAAVQTRPPQPNITIALRDDLTLPPGGIPLGVESPPGSPATRGVPPPSDLIPPTSIVPIPPRPSDGAWVPGSGAATSSPSIPATIPSLSGPSGSPTLPPGDTRTPPPPRMEYNTTGPADPFRAPPASIPGPPLPLLPLPPAASPAPPTIPPPGTRSFRPVQPGANFALVDALERPWEFATSRSGAIVLLEFMTTTCDPCRRAVPTLIDLQAQYAASGLQMIGVVCDEAPLKDRAALASKYQHDFNLNYLLCVEPGSEPGTVRNRFLDSNDGYPTAVLLDPEGKVVWKGHPGNRASLESAIRQQLGK
jgi:thiol-disulfide isomerase/thioredoxin